MPLPFAPQLDGRMKSILPRVCYVNTQTDGYSEKTNTFSSFCWSELKLVDSEITFQVTFSLQIHA